MDCYRDIDWNAVEPGSIRDLMFILDFQKNPNGYYKMSSALWSSPPCGLHDLALWPSKS